MLKDEWQLLIFILNIIYAIITFCILPADIFLIKYIVGSFLVIIQLIAIWKEGVKGNQC